MVLSGRREKIKRHVCQFVLLWGTVALLAGCDDRPWNNPYPESEDKANVFYNAFNERPKHMDPARSYSSNEYTFIAQIYEPPLQYHYLKRPYQLVPLTATTMPQPIYTDADGNPVEADDPTLAYSIYEVTIQKGIRYQPHPCFARDDQGRFRYHGLAPDDLESVHTLSDFKYTGTRELTAADYVYQIKRLAHPATNSPILSTMAEYIHGLREYAGRLREQYDIIQSEASAEGRGQEQLYLDLRRFDFDGVELVDRYTYRIKIEGKYPQIVYWLAMPFFAPIPWEAAKFYNQTGMAERNLNLHWYPVGTGPYMLTENNPNRRMVLSKNPHFHGETFPSRGEPHDREQGFLADAGKSLPFIDKVVYSLEKENIPYWNKFLQGFYDSSGINAESFDQVVQMGSQGELSLTEEMREKGIKLISAVQASTYYMGFNMKDDVVGGLDQRSRKLRQAISIAVDYEEYIAVFLNGIGIPAQGPIPPGIFGYQEGQTGINPYVYDWVDGAPKRRSIDYAKQLLAEADYADGIDQRTGKPLVLYFDTVARGPQSRAELDWLRKQFQKIDIQLSFRETTYNRFQQKMLQGSAQIFRWGWNADYPDPENFFFLLYGPNGKVDYKGENAANYNSAAFDRLFEQMKTMPNTEERLAIIEEMTDILRKDAPWVWGLHPESYGLYHQWVHNIKPHVIANNTLKYKRIEPDLRHELRTQWNQPVTWPIWAVIVMVLAVILPAMISHWRREHKSTKPRREGSQP